MTTLSINDSLKAYSTSLAVEGWDGREWVRQLHAWCGRLNAAFALDVATPAILIDRLRARKASVYRAGRNGFGILHQLAFNKSQLDRPLPLILTEVLRELLREWQSLHGTPSPGGHFNRPLRAKAETLGLYLDRRGAVLRVAPGPFTQLLIEHGLDVAVLALPWPKKAPGQSKLKKWRCGCTNIRAAVAIRVRCLACGKRFIIVEAL